MKHSLKTTEVVSCLPRAFVARVPPTVRCAAAHARTSPQTPRHKHATLCMHEKAVERAACMARAVAASQSRCRRLCSVLGANGTPPPRPRSVTTLRLSSKGQRGTPCDAYIRAGQAPTPPSGAVCGNGLLPQTAGKSGSTRSRCQSRAPTLSLATTTY